MSKAGKTKLSNVGLPSDRRESAARTPLGESPADGLSIKGSGYDKPFSKPGASLPDAGKISKSKANGSF